MNEEIPIANPPFSAEEKLAVSKLSDQDLHLIDATILANCSPQWSKVAQVVGQTVDALESRFPEMSYVFYAQRISYLVDKGQLESQGNLEYMRFSEVRLPTQMKP